VSAAPADGPPTLSVVLPCRNGAATIAVQLEALARQSWHGSWELVVVDNGSTDESMRIVERFADRLPALRVVDASAKRGVPAALNEGVRAARGRLVVFVNDDDEVGKGWLAAMAAALERYDVVGGRLEYDRLNEAWAVAVRERPQETGLLEWGFLDYLPFAAGASLGVRRELHDAVGGFDEAMVPAAEDMDYCWRLQQAGGRIGFAPDAVTHYRLRTSLRALFRQGVGYGVGHVLAYSKHRRLGLAAAPHPWRRGVRGWLGLVRRLPSAVGKVGRGRLVWHAGLKVGLLKASLEHRVVFF
jgi:GT2 family glycosyltransferase